MHLAHGRRPSEVRPPRVILEEVRNASETAWDTPQERIAAGDQYSGVPGTQAKSHLRYIRCTWRRPDKG